MAKKNKNAAPKSSGTGQAAAKTGVFALLTGALVWLTGGVSRENGFEWLKSLAIAITLALAIRWVFAEPFKIPSGSMEPTFLGDPRLFHGDRVFVNKWIYGLRFPFNHCRVIGTNIHLNYADKRIWQRSSPERWDIVVFKTVEDNAQHTTLVKRVVGLPGERIHIHGGKIYANGDPLELPPGMPDVYYTSPGTGYFIDPSMKYGIIPDEEYGLVPDGCYLVLGDNSAHSRDGRVFGWLPEEHILGRVSCIWWPPNRWRDFTGFSDTLWWKITVALVSALLVWRIVFGRSWRVYIEVPGAKRPKSNHLYINRWSFGLPIPFTALRLLQWASPKRGDLVLYRTHGKDQPEALLGRIAGLPGERVYLEEGKLNVEGKPLEGPSAFAEREFVSGEGVGPYGRSKGNQYSRVPEGQYFILTESTDPEDHLDGRTLGWTPHKDLIGKATAIWWPPARWRKI